VPSWSVSEQPSQCVSTILASACVGQNITREENRKSLKLAKNRPGSRSFPFEFALSAGLGRLGDTVSGAGGLNPMVRGATLGKELGIIIIEF
jgi:hypothetical protein